jgi:hypothetical protein
MKLAIVLFLILLPLGLGASDSGEGRFSEIGKLNNYILVKQDITRLKPAFRKDVVVPSRMHRPIYNFSRQSEGPVICERTSRPWDDGTLPMRNNFRRERLYAILPNSISFSEVKKRLYEKQLFRRIGSKEHDR